MDNRSVLKNTLWREYYTDGPGTVKRLPEKGMPLFFFLLGTYFWQLIKLNLLTIVLCLPVFTIPAAICGLSRAIMKLSMDGYGLVFSEYWSEFKASLFRYIPFSLITAILAGGSIYAVALLIGVAESIAGYFLISLCAIVFLLIYLLWCYAFTLFAIIDLPMMCNIQNAILLAVTERKRNVLLVLLPLNFVVLLIVLSPWSLFAVLLFAFSFTALMICCIIKPVINEKIIQPYLNKAGGDIVG